MAREHGAPHFPGSQINNSRNLNELWDSIDALEYQKELGYAKAGGERTRLSNANGSVKLRGMSPKRGCTAASVDLKKPKLFQSRAGADDDLFFTVKQ